MLYVMKSKGMDGIFFCKYNLNRCNEKNMEKRESTNLLVTDPSSPRGMRLELRVIKVSPRQRVCPMSSRGWLAVVESPTPT